jgi:hypothetical protein
MLFILVLSLESEELLISSNGGTPFLEVVLASAMSIKSFTKRMQMTEMLPQSRVSILIQEGLPELRKMKLLWCLNPQTGLSFHLIKCLILI